MFTDFTCLVTSLSFCSSTCTSSNLWLWLTEEFGGNFLCVLSNITYIVRLFLGDVQLLAVERKEEKAVMGISAKWIKSLVGIKKHEKGRNAECSDAVSQPYRCL